MSMSIGRFNSLLYFSNPTRRVVRQSSTSSFKSKHLVQRHFDEISIPVPWGHIAGKWYGPKHVRPIVGMHGWQDNAGTFDQLAPLLPTHLSFLSIDMPGHGLSSWLPPGLVYHSIDYVVLMQRLMDQYNWDKISIIAHSMSSINGFVFSALFPNKVDMFVSLDILKPLVRSPKNLVDVVRERLESINKYERRIREGSEPPCYDWDEMAERLHHGTDKSVSLEACKFLLQRNSRPSSHEPHKYYFARDSRLKNSIFYTFSLDVVNEMASRIKCPHLFIKALQAPYFERKEYYDATLKVLQGNPEFEYHEVDGTHHVHLNEPEKIAPIINSFINRWRPM